MSRLRTGHSLSYILVALLGVCVCDVRVQGGKSCEFVRKPCIDNDSNDSNAIPMIPI